MQVRAVAALAVVLALTAPGCGERADRRADSGAGTTKAEFISRANEACRDFYAEYARFEGSKPDAVQYFVGRAQIFGGLGQRLRDLAPPDDDAIDAALDRYEAGVVRLRDAAQTAESGDADAVERASAIVMSAGGEFAAASEGMRSYGLTECGSDRSVNR